MTPDFVDENSFPVREGERMCPRCMCCSVLLGAAAPIELHLPSVLRAMILCFADEQQFLDSHPNGRKAWFCKGGCNEDGAHQIRPRRSDLPSFIGYVVAPATERSISLSEPR